MTRISSIASGNIRAWSRRHAGYAGVLGLAVAGLLAVAAPAALAETPGSVALQVNGGGLDLRTQAGQQAFQQRIDIAAHRACAQAYPDAALTSSVTISCVREAKAGAAPQVSALIASAKSKAMLASASPRP